MNLHLLLPEVQDYLIANEQTDLSRFILSGSPFEDINIQELAQQLEGLQKTKEKLPSWHGTAGIFFPKKVNLEQTSSERAAAYKASLLDGNTLVDLTGGLGVDSYFFSKKMKHVDYCEINEELAFIAAHNFQKLDAGSISLNTQNGIDFLKKQTSFYDAIYLDPSRRDNANSKVFLLKDCEPNVPEHIDFLLSKAEKIMVKTSPLLDIKAGLDELKAVSEIHIVAVKNEVKEILWILKNDNLPSKITLFTVNITPDTAISTTADYYEALRSEPTFAPPQRYLYEPNAALMKSGLFNWISAFYKVDKLHTNTHLYTSDALIEFPGRRFVVNNTIPYSKKAASFFKGKKANITTRNFKESVAQLRKRFKINQGGDNYLFFTTCEDQAQYIIECSKA
ncbi:THUMP-like domain-containing protein [Flavimarina sp. Hel_I_48]|uniref:THUMP-like domain-containing protein n=1 Tax=Flavimarina sp. Hel_I_48 TaxID=1392488 RepID=UPI0004DF7269|nr:class I SAM-dependent methyltransferase [Flavimarina sp. Hel_I_48]